MFAEKRFVPGQTAFSLGTISEFKLSFVMSMKENPSVRVPVKRDSRDAQNGESGVDPLRGLCVAHQRKVAKSEC